MPETARASTSIGFGIAGPVVIRATRLPENSMNQIAPSGPVVTPYGLSDVSGSGKSVITPAGVIRPIRPP